MTTAVCSVIFVVVYLGGTLWLCRGLKLTTKALCLAALTCAMTLLLSSIMIPLPTGAAITCASWVPLMVLSLVYDYRLAMVSGWVCGVLAIFLLAGWAPVHWAQFFLEHLIAFSALGYAGVLGNQRRGNVILGVLLAILLRFIAQVLSGVIFFADNAWDGWGAWGYSLGYHISSKVPESIVTLLILMALPLPILERAAKGGARK